MSFIQVDQSLVTHRKTLRLARLLGLDRYAVVGRLVALWTWCLDNALNGCLGDDIDADVLADVMAWDAALGKPAELLEALLTSGFLELDPTDERIHIHDWYQHMGRLIERREADADRQRRRRARLSDADAADTDALDVDVTGDDELPVTRTSRGRHADVTRQSRVEKNRVEQSRVTSEDSGSPKRERAHEAPSPSTPAADAALSLVAPAPVVMADLPATPSATPATSPSSNPANPANPASKRPKPATSAKVTPLSAASSARVRDPVWDACIAAMGAAPSNRVERGRWATGIKALKESLSAAAPPGSPITEAIAAEIHVRSTRYRTRFGTSVPLNPMALAGNWSTLAQDVQEDQRHGNFQSRNGQHSGSGQHAAYGRRDGRRDGRPAIGTPAYYAQAAQAAQAQRSNTDTGGASGEGFGAAAVRAVNGW